MNYIAIRLFIYCLSVETVRLVTRNFEQLPLAQCFLSRPNALNGPSTLPSFSILLCWFVYIWRPLVWWLIDGLTLRDCNWWPVPAWEQLVRYSFAHKVAHGFPVSLSWVIRGGRCCFPCPMLNHPSSQKWFFPIDFWICPVSQLRLAQDPPLRCKRSLFEAKVSIKMLVSKMLVSKIEY